MKLNRTRLAAALAPIALAGGILAPVAAAQPRTAGSGPVRQAPGSGVITKDFYVYNQTGHPVRLASLTNADPFHIQGGPPAIGSVLAPGQWQRFLVIYQPNGVQVDAHYESADPNWDGQFTASMAVDKAGIPAAQCSAGLGSTCTPSDGLTQWAAMITLLDPAK